MARAKRHYLQGYVWHITHRCHKKDHLLKLVKDRQRWLYWLFQAKKRYGLCILNYIVTSNHIYLLVVEHNKTRLGIPSKYRKIIEDEDDCQLRDGQTRCGDRGRIGAN